MASKSNKTVAAKKPGPSGNFHGLRLQFLKSEIDNFLSRVRTKLTLAYWPELSSVYWRRGQWRLDLSVEMDAEMFHQSVWPHHDVTKKIYLGHRDVCTSCWVQGIMMSVAEPSKRVPK